MKIKNINKNFIIWFIVCFFYLIFIGLLTWLYPFGGDELVLPNVSFFQDIKNFYTSPFMAIRIGCAMGSFFVHIGKIFYDIINPFLQLTVIFSAFYLIYMRFPRFDSLKDFLPFLLILSLGTFFITIPAEVLLWIGGATNYAWVFIAFIWFLIYLRKLEARVVFKNKKSVLLFFVWGLFLGMMNENNSPMVLCLMIGFIVYSHFRKIILRRDFWYLMFGVILGIFVLFNFSGNNVRLEIISFGFPAHNSIGTKLFMHLAHINDLAMDNLWLIYLLPLFLFLLCLDKKKEIIKDNNFYLSCISWIIAFGLAIVLCEAPRVATRAFYSASWFCIFSLLFMLIEIEKLYKINLIKYFAMVFFLIFLYFAPFFAIGVITINNSVMYRQNLINMAKENGRKEIYLDSVSGFNLSVNNLRIPYYDSLIANKKWSKIEGIEIKNNEGESVRHI